MSSGPYQVERFAPVSPQAAFRTLQASVRSMFSVKDVDDFTLTMTFSSGASMFTWGENFTAQVVPVEGGSSVRLQGVGKVGGQVQQNARLNKLSERLFKDYVSRLRAQQAAN